VRVSFNAAARAELIEAVAFYNERAPGLGNAFAAEVRSTLTRIVEHPSAGFEARPKIRRRLLLRFPYSLLYSVDVATSSLHVIAVMHHSRGPTFWEDRL
jgi:plasmid stabilization system protein ParE